MNFKLWLEDQESEINDKLSQIFNQAKQRLLGTTHDYSLSLNRLEGGSAKGGQNKGPAVAERVLGPIFQQLESLGEPFQSQASTAINWLQKISNGDIKVNADWTVGRLLTLMFGKEHYEKFTGETAPTGDIDEPPQRGSQDVTHVPDDSKPSNAYEEPDPFQSPNKQQISQEPMGQANFANSANLSW